MRATVKTLRVGPVEHSTDELVDLVLHVGPIDGPGEELFSVSICTPAALANPLARDGLLVGRHYLFIDHVSIGRIEGFINDRLRRLNGDTWAQLAHKIAHIGLWEFEDYQEYTDPLTP